MENQPIIDPTQAQAGERFEAHRRRVQNPTEAEFIAHEIHDRIERPADDKLRTALAVAELVVAANGENTIPATKIEAAAVPNGNFRVDENEVVTSMDSTTASSLVTKLASESIALRNNKQGLREAEAVGANKFLRFARSTDTADILRSELHGKKTRS